jgi:two-component system response regulator CpxR
MESILIIDDDISLCSMLEEYLSLQKMKLAISHHGLKGLEEARSGRFDMILLDIMLPGIDGFDVLRRLRPVSDAGILLLTSRTEVRDRITGLESGADDYLPKPFNPRELVARIRNILRRRAMPPTDGHSGSGKKSVSAHGFDLDGSTRSVRYRGTPLALTDAEFSLLEALLELPGVVRDREYLFSRISQRPFHPFDRSLDMLVSRLRRKLDFLDKPGHAIRTIRNSGYVFTVSEREPSGPRMLGDRAMGSV